MEKFTEMEQIVIDAFIPRLYAEPGYSDDWAEDLAKDTGIDIKKLRGVLSSLVKKGVVTVSSYETDFLKKNKRGYKWIVVEHYMIYLNENFYYLHPTWKAEV